MAAPDPVVYTVTATPSPLGDSRIRIGNADPTTLGIPADYFTTVTAISLTVDKDDAPKTYLFIKTLPLGTTRVSFLIEVKLLGGTAPVQGSPEGIAAETTGIYEIHFMPAKNAMVKPILRELELQAGRLVKKSQVLLRTIPQEVYELMCADGVTITSLVSAMRSGDAASPIYQAYASLIVDMAFSPEWINKMLAANVAKKQAGLVTFAIKLLNMAGPRLSHKAFDKIDPGFFDNLVPKDIVDEIQKYYAAPPPIATVIQPPPIAQPAPIKIEEPAPAKKFDVGKKSILSKEAARIVLGNIGPFVPVDLKARLVQKLAKVMMMIDQGQDGISTICSWLEFIDAIDFVCNESNGHSRKDYTDFLAFKITKMPASDDRNWLYMAVKMLDNGKAATSLFKMPEFKENKEQSENVRIQLPSAMRAVVAMCHGIYLPAAPAGRPDIAHAAEAKSVFDVDMAVARAAKFKPYNLEAAYDNLVAMSHLNEMHPGSINKSMLVDALDFTTKTFQEIFAIRTDEKVPLTSTAGKAMQQFLSTIHDAVKTSLTHDELIGKVKTAYNETIVQNVGQACVWQALCMALEQIPESFTIAFEAALIFFLIATDAIDTEWKPIQARESKIKDALRVCSDNWKKILTNRGADTILLFYKSIVDNKLVGNFNPTVFSVLNVAAINCIEPLYKACNTAQAEWHDQMGVNPFIKGMQKVLLDATESRAMFAIPEKQAVDDYNTGIFQLASGLSKIGEGYWWNDLQEGTKTILVRQWILKNYPKLGTILGDDSLGAKQLEAIEKTTVIDDWTKTAQELYDLKAASRNQLQISKTSIFIAWLVLGGAAKPTAVAFTIPGTNV
jgi:hypothetical protein